MKEKIKIICPKHKNISKIVTLEDYKYIQNVIKKHGSNVKINDFWFCNICGKRLKPKHKNKIT